MGSSHKVQKEEFENKIAQPFMKPWKERIGQMLQFKKEIEANVQNVEWCPEKKRKSGLLLLSLKKNNQKGNSDIKDGF